MSDSLLASLVWQGGDLSLMESTTLWRTDRGYALRGAVVGALERIGFSARYRVECTKDWLTRSAWVELTRPPEVLEAHITVDASSRWLVDGVERPDLDGLTDIDIQITPSTNTLPIRRLSLPVGGQREVTAAWVRFPGLDVQRLIQGYHRVAERKYEYRSGDFRAELDVNEHGLVERYGSFWRRLPL
jgi:hypothetical protein